MSLSILILPSWYPSEMDPNGVPFIRAQAQALVRAGHNVTVVFTQPYSLKTVIKQKRFLLKTREDVVQGVREILTYRPKTHFRRFDENTRLRKGKGVLRKLLKSGYQPDLIHVHTFLAGNLALWLKKRIHVPLVVTEHYTGFARGIVKSWEKKRAYRLYRRSDLNLAVSQSFADMLQKQSGAHFTVLPNMVNTDLFSPPPLKKEIIPKENISKKLFTLLFVGSLHDKKNPVMLLKAFHKNYSKNKNLRLILAGEGELSSFLKDYVKAHQLENVVDFPGFLQPTQVADQMRAADAFILPSRFETFGIVVIEAMATGLPVIVTRSGGPESFVISGENGIIIDQDQKELEEAIQSLHVIEWNPETIRRYVIDNFSEEAVVAQLTEHYQSLLDNPKIIQASRELNTSGGISKVAYRLALHLTELGSRVETLTTTQPEDLAQENIGSIRVIKIPGWVEFLPGYLKNYWKTKIFTRKVDQIYRQERKDPRVVTISHRDSYGADIAVGHSCHKEAVEIKKSSGRSLWFLNPIHRYYLKQERRIFSSSLREDHHTPPSLRGDKVPPTSLRGEEVPPTSLRGDKVPPTSLRGDKVPPTSLRGDEVDAAIYPPSSKDSSLSSANRSPHFVRDDIRRPIRTKKNGVYLAAISQSISEEYQRHYSIPKDRVRIIPNGVDTKKFNPAIRDDVRPTILKELDLDQDAFILLLAGNEFWRKGLMPLVESLAVLKESGIFPIVVVVGGADRKPFIQKGKELGVMDQLRFVGRKDNIENYFAAADLFVLPTSYEPFGLVGIEAMAAGLPLLAPIKGGIADYLIDGKNGLDIKIDPVDIAGKVKFLYRERAMIHKLGKEAGKTALNYRWETIAQQYKDLIEEIFREKI